MLYPHIHTHTWKAVKMTSVKTQLPYEYYTLRFCSLPQDKIHYKTLNLGMVNLYMYNYNVMYYMGVIIATN